jgi:crotonobetainyl-CoA:carnitine CoA-transferase CaiB-like acyl-CoA transferase
MVTELDWYKGIGTPIKFSRTKGGTRRPPPKFGEHAREILTQHGYAEAEIDALQAAGVIQLQRRI